MKKVKKIPEDLQTKFKSKEELYNTIRIDLKPIYI